MSLVTWNEFKRLGNIRKHGLDFVGCEDIWQGFTVTREDIRHGYGERRMVTLGLLRRQVVVLVYTERYPSLHVISLRKAERYEARYYVEEAKKFQGDP
jgi:uncharacterized DUF497 family protein